MIKDNLDVLIVIGLLCAAAVILGFGMGGDGVTLENLIPIAIAAVGFVVVMFWVWRDTRGCDD